MSRPSFARTELRFHRFARSCEHALQHLDISVLALCHHVVVADPQDYEPHIGEDISENSVETSLYAFPPYEANDLERRPRRRPDPIPAFDSDPRFRVRTSSPLTRDALLLFIAFLFWLAFNLRRALWIENGMGTGHAPVAEVDPSH